MQPSQRYNWQCDCGKAYCLREGVTQPIVCSCGGHCQLSADACESRKQKTIFGPGHHLTSLLSEADRWLTFARWFPGLQAYSLKASAGCGCAEMARQMDNWGPQGCRDNMQLILDHLREEAKERGIRYIETVARLLVREAIRRAEK